MTETKNEYNLFHSKYVEQMQELNNLGLKLASVEDIMRLRLEHEHKPFTLDVHSDFSTGDAILRGNKNSKEFKIELDSDLLRNISSNDQYCNGSLILTQDQYDASHGIVLKNDELCSGLYKDDFMNSRLWNVLAREDKSLMSSYFDYVVSREKWNPMWVDMSSLDASSLQALIFYGTCCSSGISCRLELPENPKSWSGSWVAITPEVKDRLQASRTKLESVVDQEVALVKPVIIAPTLDQMMQYAKPHVSEADWSVFQAGMVAPTLDQVMQYAKPLVSENNWDNFQAGLQQLYKQK